MMTHAFVLRPEQVRFIAAESDRTGASKSEVLRSLLDSRQALVAAITTRIADHDRTVRRHGGRSCQDDFCQTFKPLVGTLAPH